MSRYILTIRDLEIGDTVTIAFESRKAAFDYLLQVFSGVIFNGFDKDFGAMALAHLTDSSETYSCPAVATLDEVLH